MAKMTYFNFDTYLPERKIIVRDTAQLPSRERLEERIRAEIELLEISLKNGGSDSPHNDEELLEVFRLALAAHEQEPVGIVHGVAQTLDGSSFVAMVECKTRLSDGTELFSHPAPVPAVHLSPDTEYMDEDAECLAMNLDKHNVPKEKGGQELSLWGRVVEFCNQQAPVPAVPMAVAGFNAATAIRACMEEFPESMHDIVEECAQIAENTISTSHAAPVPAVPELVSIIGELTSAIRSINRAPHHIAKGVDDDEPCYWQRKEWIDWILELASSADENSRAAMLNGGKS